MSASETVDSEIGKCPCGKGHIVKSVTTQDNPWSSADIHYSIGCATCAAEWRIDSGGIVDCSSEVPYHAAREVARTSYQTLIDFVNSLVNKYFASFSAKTKKAEHDEMVRLNITTDNYRSFLKTKITAKNYADACYGLRNVAWLTGLARQEGREREFTMLLDGHESAKASEMKAYGQIVRLRISS